MRDIIRLGVFAVSLRMRSKFSFGTNTLAVKIILDFLAVLASDVMSSALFLKKEKKCECFVDYSGI